jgi:hypothetical protein
MTQVDAWRMLRKRALAAGIMAPIGNHSFRVTGITAYLANGGTLEHAQSMAAHAANNQALRSYQGAAYPARDRADRDVKSRSGDVQYGTPTGHRRPSVKPVDSA